MFFVRILKQYPMPDRNQYDIQNIDLTGDYYKIKQSLIRNKYKLTDKNDDVVLKGKQKMFKMKEEFPFVNGSGDEAFTVRAGGILDVAGTYTLFDSVTEQPVVVLDEDLTLFVENWKIRDPSTEEVLATIKSKNKVLSALRHLSDLANIAPNKYEIFDASGKKIGEIAGELSIKDTYKVTIDRESNVPREAVIASACVLDALENKSS